MSFLPLPPAGPAPAPHPCFDRHAAGRHGRLHLPVAGSCNIRCNYCNRRYDCAHESRPGVSSTLLSPEEAATHVDDILAKMPWITVAGIAGPGDAFADPQPTLSTLEAVRRRHPKLHLCLSTNGLALVEHIPTLIDLKVGFVTITVNALEPQIGARIYRSLDWRGKRLQGAEAAGLLLDRQQEAISCLAAAGFTVKINTVVIPAINADHCPAIASATARLGAKIHNLIPIIPVQGTPFADFAPPTGKQLENLRKACEIHLPQMRHCMRCRADSIGLLSAPFKNKASRSAATLSLSATTLPTMAR